VVLQAIDKGCAIEALPLSDLTAICDKIEDDVYAVLQLEYGVNQRNILGGTSKETVTKALYQELENLDKQSN
jgi:argininosuccinate lyase